MISWLDNHLNSDDILDGCVRVGMPVTISQKSTKKNKAYEEIKYQSVEDCIQYTTDTKWIKLFRDIARGKLPNSFAIRNNVIAYTQGNGNANVRLDLEGKFLYESLVSLFVNYYRIQQPNTKEKTVVSSPSAKVEWKYIRKRDKKRTYINRFLEKKAEEYGWSSVMLVNACKEVIQALDNGILLYKEVNFVDEEIRDIKGLIIDKNGVAIENPRSSSPSKFNSRQCPSSKIHITKLNKCEHLYKVKQKKKVEESESAISA